MGILSSVAKVLESPRRCDDSLVSFSVHRATVTVSPQSHQGRESTLEREDKQAVQDTEICLSQNKVWKYSTEPSQEGTLAQLPRPSQGNFPLVYMEREWVWASLLSSLGERKIKPQKAAEPAEERQRSMASEGPARSVLLLLLAQENNRVGYSPSSGLRAVPPSLLSHPSCPPPMLLLPQLLLARRKADD